MGHQGLQHDRISVDRSANDRGKSTMQSARGPDTDHRQRFCGRCRLPIAMCDSVGRGIGPVDPRLSVLEAADERRAMVRFVFAWIVVGQALVSAAQMEPPTTVAACRAVEVTVATSTPMLRAGTRPEFSVVVANKSDRSVRVLDVRNGRRNDLQDVYFELFIVEGRRVVDLPSVISDPGPISDADYAVLKPGERIEVRPLSYTRSAEGLPPGKYSAFILFWQNPETRSSRCRSTEARFVVSD